MGLPVGGRPKKHWIRLRDAVAQELRFQNTGIVSKVKLMKDDFNLWDTSVTSS
jgi:hypothetical protein